MTNPQSLSEGSEPQNKMWHEKTQYQILLFAGGVALFILVGGWILDWYINPRTSGQKKDLVQALGLITAGVAGALGIYMTWRGQRHARDTQEENQRNTLAQLENAREQLELARRSQEDSQRNTQAQLEQSRNELAVSREGQITERFTKAIEQIGATSEEGKNLEMRLGGIHALERISRESENDYWSIMEILSAYVREHAPRDPAAGADLDKGVAEADLDKGAAKNDVLKRLPFSHAEADIQTILDTIGRRFRTWMKEEELRIRLEETDLRGATFFMANLTGVWFFKADLGGAYLRECNLKGAAFGQANLQNTVFEKVDLQVAVGLTQKQINQAFGYETELPDYLSKPAHWD
jgi:hypothetical protein